MGEKSDTLVHEVEEARAALDYDLGRLEHLVKEELNSQVRYAKKHAWLLTMVTIGCAVFVGLLIGRRRRS